MNHGQGLSFIVIQLFGIQLFFVLSGYVISMSTDKIKDVRVFFVKRLSRVVPSYWLITLIAFVVMVLFPSVYGAPSFGHLVKSLLFIPYFNPETKGGLHPVLYVGWTMNMEIIFYLLYGMCLIVSHRARDLIVSVVLLIATYSAIQMPTTGIATVDFYFVTHWFSFVLGLGVASVHRKMNQSAFWIDRPFRTKTSVCSCLALISVFCVIAQGFDSAGCVWAIVLVALIIFEKLFPIQEKISKRLSFAGGLAFSMYLTHPLTMNLLSHFLKSKASTGSVVFGLVFYPTMIAVATCFYLVVDQPLYMWVQTWLMEALEPRKRRGFLSAVHPELAS